MKINEISASFKDPSGFVFSLNGEIYRQINKSYQKNYEQLITSGLYDKLTSLGYLIPYQEINFTARPAQAYKTIQPTKIPFISYPYEWCFNMLKDAAQLTLNIQKIALEYGMSLKDASSFNVQFLYGKPVFIDTLSFEQYEEGKPWVAYKQFCEQFLAPLALIAYTDIRLGKLMQAYLKGIPLDLVCKLLPLSTKIRPALFFHIHLHSRSQKQFSNSSLKQTNKSFSKHALMGLIESLESTVRGLHWKPIKTVLTDYYEKDKCISYDDTALNEKKNLVSKYLDIVQPKTLWDIGSNTGVFSRIAAKKNIFVVSMDNDPSVVEQNYLWTKENREKNILPLIIDIVNPTPSVGWENLERNSIFLRPLPQTVLALALIHHLAIGENLPFLKLASFFAKICDSLIIEFIPKEDKHVYILLRNRKDIFDNYNQTKFESEFNKFFNIKKRSILPASGRSLYLMINRKIV
jgi:hypothetical protein